MKKYCICVSGDLGLIVLKNLIDENVPIVCVLTDTKSEEIIVVCHEQRINVFAGNPREGKAEEWIKRHDISFDILLSINYLFILETDILRRADIAINFHGSLLPKYRGRTPHVWAIINGEKECGITAHFMNSECDDGDIIKQVHVTIEDDDTGAGILKKYNDIYPSLVQDIVEKIESGSIDAQKQDITKATYFNKRTPGDGQIDWNWQKERIRNWVRAQAEPYPGAFSFVEGEKIIINKILYSDYGFTYDMPNGLIIGSVDEKPIVKTSNGAVILDNYRCQKELKQGDILV